MAHRQTHKRRLPLIVAATTATILATALGTTGSAGAAPSSKDRLAQGVKTSKHSLMAAAVRQDAQPRGLNGNRTALPARGKYGFLLKLSTRPTITAYRLNASSGRAAARSAARAQLGKVHQAQNSVVADLPSGSRVLYKTHSVLSGVAVRTDVNNFSALKRIGGVTAVYPISPKTPSNDYAVPLQGAPQTWTALGNTGQNSTVAVIDTGIDYTHANFGGPGTIAAYDTAHAAEASPADPALFPSAKVIGGFDFAGDSYFASSDDEAAATPHPDPNPLDCNGHGSHVAGSAAGFGVNDDAEGTTYTGPYNTSTPFDTLRIGPGMAPQAKLYAFRVFGCDGDSLVVAAAIDRASDPNGDGDPSDRADVINMSLGDDFASPQDADAMLTNAAVQKGISVVTSAGNAGDLYDVGGSPGNAVRALSTAASIDASTKFDALHVDAPAAIAGDYKAERSVAYDWIHKPDLSGAVVPLSEPDNLDGCDPLNAADAAAVLGKVAFLEWTDDDTARRCGSAARAANVVAAGAIGFVFADDQETFAAGITGSAVIPGVMVVKSAGDAIRAQLSNGVHVSGTSVGTIEELVPADNDKVIDFSSRGIRGPGNVKPDVTAVGTSVFSTSVGTGDKGETISGTSMASPMVAGLSALVRTAHPEWTPEEVKADIMNTAGQDLFTGDNHSGLRYAPNRVGAGRIDAKAALDNSVLAYVGDGSGAVSASFGPLEVTSPITLTKAIKVSNKGLTAATYAASYEALTEVPGATYSVSPASVTVGARSSATVTVTLTIDPSMLTKTVDPTVDREQGGLPRDYVADASGRVLLASAGRPTLRVPVYSAPRPASKMTQPASITMPSGSVQTALLPLTGQQVNQGAGETAVKSLVAGFELQAKSGLAPSCSATVTAGCVGFPDQKSADLKYVGTTSSAPQLSSIGGDPLTDGLAYFAISTQGPWRTAAGDNEFDIWIDSNGDGEADVVTFTTRLSDAQDVFVSLTVDLASGDVIDAQPINDRFGDIDTAIFDSDTMVVPVAIAALPGLTSSKSRIAYGIDAFAKGSDPAIDTVGLDDEGNPDGSLTTDVLHPGVAVYGSFDGDASPILFRDSPGSVLQIRRERDAYAADHGMGVLMVHFHNAVGNKAQVLSLNSTKVASSVSLKLSKTKVKHGSNVTATVTVKNTAGVAPTGKVTLKQVGGAAKTFGSATLKNGTGKITFKAPKKGSYSLQAQYAGDANYASGKSATVKLNVT